LEVEWLLVDVCEISNLCEVGLESCDVVVVVIGDDKVNFVVLLIVKMEFGVFCMVVWVNNFKNEWMFDEVWGVDVVVLMLCLMMVLVEEVVSVGDFVWIF